MHRDRDFRPDNVMVGLDDRPCVLDFGLAHPAASDNEDELLLPDAASVPMTRKPLTWDAASSGPRPTLGPQTDSISGSNTSVSSAGHVADLTHVAARAVRRRAAAAEHRPLKSLNTILFTRRAARCSSRCG